MTREQVPLISSDECCRALSRAGFEPARRSKRGSHQTWKKRAAERTYVVVVVLGKRQIPRGTLENIIEQAGLTVLEFVSYLR